MCLQKLYAPIKAFDFFFAWIICDTKITFFQTIMPGIVHLSLWKMHFKRFFSERMSSDLLERGALTLQFNTD